jgi:hypothetical protein
MPIDGKRIGSHAHPNTWYVITLIKASARRESM